METTLQRISFHQFTDDQLMSLLAAKEDRLPRDVVDEFVVRGERMIWRLTDLCRDERSWTQTGPAFWAPVHATFILGAFEDSRALMGLLASLRWSAKYDVDWVYEKLPSILGRIGRPAILPLKARMADRDTGELDRRTELEALAGIAAHHPIHQGEVLDFIRSIADDSDEKEGIRSVAASLLLKFLRPGDRKSITASAIRQEWSDRPPHFDARDVDAAYAKSEQQLEEYLQDGLAFYDGTSVKEFSLPTEGGTVTMISEAPRGTLWFGMSKGLLRYRGGELRTFGRAEGLNNENVSNAFLDHEGRFWIVSRGLFVAESASAETFRFG